MINNKITCFNLINKHSNLFFLLNNKNILNLFLTTNLKKKIILLLKYSWFFNTSILVDSIIYNITKCYNRHIKLKLANKNTNISIQSFNQLNKNYNYNLFSIIKINYNSIDKLFYNAWWLERELSELFGIFLINKLDSRNLLLPYNDTSSPLLKSSPVVGFFDKFYNLNTDQIENIVHSGS